jgi:hypothetical protein
MLITLGQGPVMGYAGTQVGWVPGIIRVALERYIYAIWWLDAEAMGAEVIRHLPFPLLRWTKTDPALNTNMVIKVRQSAL